MTLKVIPTRLPGVLVLEPDVFGDERGFFMETYNVETYRALGIDCTDILSIPNRKNEQRS